MPVVAALSLSHVRPFVTPGLPGSSVHGISPGKNTGVGCHFLLQGIFPTQGWNLCLLHCRWIDSLPAELSGKPPLCRLLVLITLGISKRTPTFSCSSHTDPLCFAVVTIWGAFPVLTSKSPTVPWGYLVP